MGALYEHVLQETWFQLPANALGLPVVTLPMALAGGLPTGVQVHADLWREDLWLEAAELIEQGSRMPLPIAPVQSQGL